MTEYFEVHERDGAGRLGELRLAESRETPGLVGEWLVDGGSEWVEQRSSVEGLESELVVLPHRAFPAGTPEEVQEAFEPDYPDVEFPSAAVVHPETVADRGTDAYVLSTASQLGDHAGKLVEQVLAVRRTIPADTALYLPGIATPANVAALSYAGVDLFDSDRARVQGSRGFYLTAAGSEFLEDLEELPCSCRACRVGRAAFDREDCMAHNEHALATELVTVRERIRAGRLRDYLEGQARHTQYATELFRHLDEEYSYLEQRTPVLRRAELTAASDDTLRRVEIQRYAQRVTERYRNRFSNPLVLVPCSARKPYSESQSHAQFHDAIDFRGHLVAMTSPIGVVPQELELTYPAQQYDSVVTGRWSASEREFVADVLDAYLERNEYPRVIAHLPDEGYRAVCERVQQQRDIEFEYTVEGHPTGESSLANLSAALEGELRYGKRERQHNTIRAVADYQFGPDAGDELFDQFCTEAHYPKLRVRDTDGEQLAMLVAQYGVLALTLEGARRWVDSPVPTDRVEIDEFVPHGSVLAPGVVDASNSIRPGDEVVIEGQRAFAVGRAEMSGPEMVESSRGIATEVRHVESR